MSRAVIFSVILATLTLASAGCPDDTGTPPDDTQLGPLTDAVRARYLELELTDERRTPALYSFGTKLTKLTPVFDAAGRRVFDAPGGWLYWSDLMPATRLYHEGLLISVADDGSLLKVGVTQLPPSKVGEIPWALSQEATRQASLKHGGARGVDAALTEAEVTLVLGLTTPAPEEPSVPGEGCVPKRVLIAVAGETYGDDAVASGMTADINAIRGWSTLPAVGISDANTHIVQPGEDGTVPLAGLEGAIAAADLQCCDEVVFYFTGHTHPERGLVLREERLVTTGIDEGAVASEGVYLDASGLFEVVGASLACNWLVVLESGHAAPFGQALIDAANTSNTASSKVKKVSVLSATSVDEPALQLKDGQGLLTSLMIARTSGDLGGANLPLDAIATEVNNAFVPGGPIGGKVLPDSSHWDAFATGQDKILSQRPVFLATMAEPSCCECASSDDCEQPNSATCRESICRAGTCVEEVEADGTLCGLQSECNAPACEAGICQSNPMNEGLVCDDGDNCTVGETCDQAGFCVGVGASCDDGNVCTDDGCDAGGACANTNNTAPCDDGIACTIDDTCADGSCGAGVPDDATCQALLNPAQAVCTQATCGAAGCTFTPRPPGPCALGELQGRCAPGGAADFVGASGTLGTCTTPDPYAQPCAEAADCQAAVDAIAGVQPGLTASCMTATCVANLCVVTAANAGTSCDVGNNCSSYACDGAGACAWEAPASPLPAECNCDPSLPVDGQCAALKDAFPDAGSCAAFHCFGISPNGYCHVLAADPGAACDPGASVCWTGVCGADLQCQPQAGVAANLTAKPGVCDDANPCTTDLCVGPAQIGADDAGCSHSCAPEGSPCPSDDTLVCGYDVAGTCGCVAPAEACLCPDPPGPCQQQTCDDGSCLVEDLPDGSSCLPDPADPCVVGTCDAGACIDGAAKSCDDENDCTADSCDPVTGACASTPTTCPLSDTMDPQCQKATCDAGACDLAVATPGALCVAGCGSPGTCSDEGQCEGYVGEDVWCAGSCAPCQVGVCDAATGACGCAAASDGVDCPGGTCAAGSCVPNECTVAADCDDSDPCTDDSCVSNACVNTDNGTCTCTVAGDCDDSDPCTVDDCVSNACTNVISAGASCDDGDACTDGDVCDAAGACGGTVNPTCCTGDGDCDDGDACTDDSCVSNACVSTDNGTCACTLATDCDDGNPCTTDDCVSNACTNVVNPGASCDDGDACTDTDICDAVGGCAGTANPSCCTLAAECDDGNPCTADDCITNACTNAPVTDGAPCDDGDACTDESCAGGTCTQQPRNYVVAAGGAVLPDMGNVAPATPMPPYLDYTGLSVLNQGAAVEVSFDMEAAIPAVVPDTYAAGTETFAEVALVFFEASLAGDPGAPYPALTGATHMLTGRNIGAAWEGQLWLWNDTTGMWELDGAVVTATLDGAMATLSGALPGITTCTPFKGLTQLRRDPAGTEELVWKLFTDAGTDPSGGPVSPL